MPGGSGQQLRKDFSCVFAQQIQRVEFFLDASSPKVMLDLGYLYQHYPWSVESKDVIDYWLGSEDFKKARRAECGLDSNEVLCKSVPKLFGKKPDIKYTTIDDFRNQRLKELFNNFLDEANRTPSESFYRINLPKDDLSLTRITIILFFYNFLPIFKDQFYQDQREKFNKLVAIAQALLPKKYSATNEFYRCLAQVASVGSVDSAELAQAVTHCLDTMSAYMTSQGAQPAQGLEGSRNDGSLSVTGRSIISSRFSDATTSSGHGLSLTQNEVNRGKLTLLGFVPFSQQTSVIPIQHSGSPGNFLEEVMHDYIMSRISQSGDANSEYDVDEMRQKKLNEAVYIKNLMRDMPVKVRHVSDIELVRDYVNGIVQDSSLSSYSTTGFRQYCALIVAHLDECLLHLGPVTFPVKGDYMSSYFAMREQLGLGKYFYEPYPYTTVEVVDGEQLGVSRVKAVAQDFFQKYDAQLELIKQLTPGNHAAVSHFTEGVKSALRTPLSNLDKQINPASILVLKDILDHVINQFYLIAYQQLVVTQGVPQSLSKKATAALQEPKYAVANILFPDESTRVEGLQRLQIFITRLAYLENFKGSRVDGEKSVVVLPETLQLLAKNIKNALDSGVNEVLEIKFQVFNLKNELEKLLRSYQALQKAGYDAGYTRGNAKRKMTDQLIVLSNITALFSVSSNFYQVINNILNTQNEDLGHAAVDKQLILFVHLRKLLSGTLTFINMQLKPQLESAGKLAEFSQDEDSLSQHILSAQVRSVAIIKLLETIESLYIFLNQKAASKLASSTSGVTDSEGVEAVIQRLADYNQELLDPEKAKLYPLVTQLYEPPGGVKGFMLNRRSIISPTKSKNPRRSHAAVYSKSGSSGDLDGYSDCESDAGRDSVHSVESTMSVMTVQSTATTAFMIDSSKQAVSLDIQEKRNNLNRFFGQILMQSPPYNPVRTEHGVLVTQLPYFEEVMQAYLVSRCVGESGKLLSKFDRVRVGSAVDIVKIMAALTEGVVTDIQGDSSKINIDRCFIETVLDYIKAVSTCGSFYRDSTLLVQKGDLQRSCILLAAYLKTMSLRLDGISIPELMHRRLSAEQVKYDYLLFYSELRSRTCLPESSFLLSPAALPRKNYQEAVLAKMRMQGYSHASKTEAPTLLQVVNKYQKQTELMNTHLDQEDKSLIAELFQLAKQVFNANLKKKVESLSRLVDFIDCCVRFYYRKAYFIAGDKYEQDKRENRQFVDLAMPDIFVGFPSAADLALLAQDFQAASNSQQSGFQVTSMASNPAYVCQKMMAVEIKRDIQSHIAKYADQINAIINFLNESERDKIQRWINLTAGVLDADQTPDDLLRLSDFFECCMRYFYQKAYRAARLELTEDAFLQLESPLPFHGVPSVGALTRVGQLYEECQFQSDVENSSKLSANQAAGIEQFDLAQLSPLVFCQEIEAEHLKQVVQDPFLKHADDLSFIQTYAPKGYSILSDMMDSIKSAMKNIKQRLTPTSMLLLLDILDVCVQYYYRVAYDVAKLKNNEHGQSCVAGKSVPIGFHRETQAGGLQKLQRFMLELSNYPYLRQSTLDEGLKTPELFRTTLQQLAVIIDCPISAPLVGEKKVADTSDYQAGDSRSMSAQESSLRYDIKSSLQSLYGLLITLVGADGYGAVMSEIKKIAYKNNELSCFQEAIRALSLHLLPCVSHYNSAGASLPSSMLMLENLQKRFDLAQDLLMVMEQYITQQIYFNLQLAGKLAPKVSEAVNLTQVYAQQAVKVLADVSSLIQSLRFLLYHPGAKVEGVTVEEIQQDAAGTSSAVDALTSAISGLISPQAKLRALTIEKENVLQVVTAFSTPSTGSSSGGKSSAVKSSSAQKSHLTSPVGTFSAAGEEGPSNHSTPRLNTPGGLPLTLNGYKTPN